MAAGARENRRTNRPGTRARGIRGIPVKAASALLVTLALIVVGVVVAPLAAAVGPGPAAPAQLGPADAASVTEAGHPVVDRGQRSHRNRRLQLGDRDDVVVRHH